MEQHLKSLSHVPLFRDLPQHELHRLTGIATTRDVPKKTVIFHEGDPLDAVYFITSGLIKASKSDQQGNEQIVCILKTGEMFPHTGFFNRTPYPCTTETMADSHLLVIPIDSFEQWMSNTPNVACKVMCEMGNKLRELETNLHDFTRKDIQHRAISLLLRLADQHGCLQDDKLVIDLAITHQEFANAIGTTRETVNRLLSQLQKEGIMDYSRHQIVIHDIKALNCRRSCYLMPSH